MHYAGSITFIRMKMPTLLTKTIPEKRKGDLFLDETIVGTQPMALNSPAQRGTPALRAIGKKDLKEE